jgi:Carbohydrate binding domain (family 11)
VALFALLPGCLVSFNDYPVGDLTEASSAGSAGTATSPGVNLLMIDDFEDDYQGIIEQEGRSGAWYAANDGKGMQTPSADSPLLPSALEPPRGDSTQGAHTFGGPFPTWGALIGTSLASSGEQGMPYDLSGFQGLKLWVRSGSTSLSAAKKVRLNLPTPATNPGGGCTLCNDHFGADIPLTSKWVQVAVPFATLKQTGSGRPQLSTPDLQHVTSLQLMFPANVSFDLWLDDIELY